MTQRLGKCTKCGAKDLTPKYHKSCGRSIAYAPHYLNSNLLNVSTKEHLHYFCSCGYDFIKEITNDEHGDSESSRSRKQKQSPKA